MRTRIHWQATLVAAATALAGCSTYVGHKVGPDGKLPADATGLPFTMTRPEYTVDITADPDDATKAIYTLKATDVPDPTQRYTLALDPALLTDGKFNLSFGTNGNLSEADATLTSQVVATLKAVASFAANRQNALKALADMGSVHTDFVQAVLNADTDACRVQTVSKPPRAVREEIADALIQLRKVAESESSKEPARDVLDRYYYKNARERECLKDVWFEVKRKLVKEEADTKTPFDDAAKALAGERRADHVARIVAIQRWVAASDAESLKKATEMIPAGEDKLGALANAGLDYVNKLKSIAERREYAQTLADMSPATWRARHAQALEKAMDALRIDIRMAHPKERKKLADTLDALEAEHAETIGGKTIWDRMRQLDKFLAEVKTTTGPDGRPRYAADEHVKLREERDKLKTQFDEMKKAFAVSGKPAGAKVPVRANVPVQIVGPDFVKQVNARKSLFDVPEFVLVLESAPQAGAPVVLFGSGN